MGRPTLFTQDIADKICNRIAEGESLRAICEDEDLPEARTVHRWLYRFEEFCQQYARAREAQADFFAEEIIEIADDGSNDWMERYDKEGDCIGWQENGEALRRSSLRVDTRKWLMARMSPKKWGDKKELTGNLNVNNITDEQLNEKISSLLAEEGEAGDIGASGGEEAEEREE